MTELETDDALERVLRYHARTKHHPQHMARGPGRMEWATQPNPFRVFEGAHRVALAHPEVRQSPTFDGLGERDERDGNASAESLSHASLSRLLYFSLAISAWKQAPGTVRWSLRVNPSSGDLHPTEGYIVAGAIAGIDDRPGVYHYSPLYHACERRRVLEEHDWVAIADQLPAGAFIVALTSVYWREAWKYGERAFRYCHHDVGHAIGALAYAAATLGWRARVIDELPDCHLGGLLGTDRQGGPEAEHPDCAVAIYPSAGAVDSGPVTLSLSEDVLRRIQETPLEGAPNVLSTSHRAWPVIDEVTEATTYDGRRGPAVSGMLPAGADSASARTVSAEALIRRRRSAMAMDGVTTLDREPFFRMLARTLPGRLPLDGLPGSPSIALAIFVHRVNGLTPGLYALMREPDQAADLRSITRSELAWERVDECPEGLSLYRLERADARQAAGIINCFQDDIAANSAFALAMLARFEPTLREIGPWFYRRLFWESGLIGQALYLEAEAAGVRATGIGCFFDDLMHEVLGIADRRWQSLYHFTVGGAVDDPRLQTIPAYAHLDAADDGGWEGWVR